VVIVSLPPHQILACSRQLLYLISHFGVLAPSPTANVFPLLVLRKLISFAVRFRREHTIPTHTCPFYNTHRETASHVRKCPRCNESHGGLRGSSSSSTTSHASMSREWTPISMLMDYVPCWPYSHYVIRLHDSIVHVVRELTTEAGAVKGRESHAEQHV
jgi:hypothetical protein